ncbi:MAG: long-chain fatty acid--CoA ligase [Deltaproteobacteria bacterium CG23_combo_of_CG06-09_8_20_14_all_51_20]|nr:long-chain fatty acid--CoA ligase [bacterium]NCP07484.1 long-chain fatty acid--CoA ligase [bacterium]OIP37187.1 MAG: long-chain fatty acid--CoA ligase [Desulfobacteraceae bacterium CG2_30_51_40]PIP48601.1 MAG: long-chain fatty acid--CoA ligase [Deltaproteobacteria bacterium CG23_combo_of_CG06-09_8_20_14_all_51_20]PIY22013.1 MAG: long-chain fatty acid--CoA ligase [Deltaproteobacteria bacterium CG_4_10_14_3_um_filter_51_14]
MASPVNPDNIFEAFASTARANADRTAVVYLGSRYTYGDLLKMAEAMAGSLVKQGLGQGMRVVVYLPNSIQWVVSWLAILRADAVAVPITPIYTSYDFGYIAKDSDASFAVCSDTNYGYVLEAMSRTNIKKVIVARLSDLLPWWKRAMGWAFDVVPKGKMSKESHVLRIRKMLKGGARELPSVSRRNLDTAEILYTGGTTKFPKGVPISHGLYLDSALEQIKTPDFLFPAGENIIIGSAPLFHILGQTCGLSVLLMGGTIALMPKVNLDAIFDAIERLKAKSLIGVPTLYRMILEHNRLDLYDLSSLRYCFNGGDVLPVELNQRWRNKFNKPIYQGYGATETCGGVAMCPTDRESPMKSIGKVVPSKQIKIVDLETLEPVAEGRPGELLVHSEKMVRSYWNKPEETAAAFVEIDGRLWYRTADIVSIDHEGNLYFVDRTVDTIKHKGYRISSSEIEAVLQEHPAVTAACAIGIPDPKVGERIKAFVVLKEDVKGITGYELIKWCKERLAAYKIPQYIEFRDMLPKSKVGKLLRREVRGEEKRRAEV